MAGFSISLSDELQKKLSLISEKSGRSMDECVVSALREYVENYEDVYKTDLCAVDNLERSFFLFVGE